MAAANSSRLFIISLAFFYLIISLNAIPISRSAHLLHENPHISVQEKYNQNVEEKLMNGGSIGLDDHDDYPRSGANNRHTPKPPF